MKNKGFTLIELLGVMVILAGLIILVFPSLINTIKSSNNTKDNLIDELIYNSVDLYIKDNANQFVEDISYTYSLSIKELEDKGYIKFPTKDYSNKENLKCVEISYNNKFYHEIKESCDANYYIIEYEGINFDDYQVNIKKGEQLKIELNEFIPRNIEIYESGIKLDSSKYSYNDNILIIDNISGNLKIIFE